MARGALLLSVSLYEILKLNPRIYIRNNNAFQQTASLYYLVSCDITISRQLFKSNIAFYNRIMILMCSYLKKICRVRGLRPLKL